MSPDRGPGSARVRFEPAGREVRVRPGAWLAGAATRAGAGLVFDCDGQGVCATCRVRVLEGAAGLPSPAPAERRQLGAAVDDGWRLACMLRVESDLTVEVPDPGGFAYPPALQPG